MENIFKEKLYQHTIPVRDGLWDAIEAQLPPKKEQRIFPLFWFTLFTTTLLGGVLMFGVFNLKQKNLIPAPAPQTSITYNDPIHDQLNSTIDSPKETTTNTTSANTNANPSANLSTSHNTRGSSDEINSSSARSLNVAGAKGKKKGSSNTTPSETTTSSSQTSSNIPLAPGNRSTNIESNTTLFTLNQTPTSEMSFLPQQEVSLTTAPAALPAISMVKPDPNCYKFSGTGNKLAFSIDAFAGPGFSPKTYALNDTESSIYADAREATENYQYAWSAGARLNLQHRSGFTGRIGLSYTQVGDVFDYTDSLATQSTTRIDSFFAADGTFLYTETSQVLILGTLIKKIHNTYRYLDVPLIIGYEMPWGRSTLLVNAGPVFNLSSSHEGQILDPNLHPRSIKEGDPGAIDVYKSNIGLSLYFGAGYLFPLSDHFSGLIEPSFIYRLDPVTLDSYPLQEKRHYASLNLGIRYHIH